MITRCLVKVAFSLLIFSTSLSAFAGLAMPVTPMQNAVSGVIQQKAIKRGFAANDPRYGATLNLVSGGLASAAGAGAAAVVLGAVTAPAWGTVALAAGVGAVVTYSVTLAINGVIDWLFSPNSADTKPITQHANQSTPVGNGLTTGSAYWITSINPAVYGSDAMSAIQAAVPLNWVETATSTFKIGACTTPTATSMSCSITRVNKSDNYNQLNYAAIGANYYASGAPGTCQPGFVYRQSSCILVPQPADSKVTAQEAINNLSPAELAKPLNPQIVASIADLGWKNAASQPGYNGLPYVASDPITAAEVETWRQSNPSAWPTVQDFVSPQPAINSPWTLPQSTTPVSTQDTTLPSSNTNPGAANPLQNLGPDPGVGAPQLEQTPTAQQILQPILNLFPTLKNYSPAAMSSGTCPRPVLNLFGHTQTMEAHCVILDNNKAAIQQGMVLAFTLLALFIVLSA